MSESSRPAAEERYPTPPPPPERPGPSWGERISAFPGTFGLIGFTLAVFLLQTATFQLIGADLVLVLGAKEKLAIASGQWWRLVTPIFIHIGLLHLFVNMYSLYVLGPVIERLFGTPRALVTYLSAGIGGVLFSLLFSPVRSVGASGAIFGFLGALAAFLYIHRETFGRAGAIQLRQLVFIALLNLFIGLQPGIDNWGHLGGLIAGVALTWSFGPRYERAFPDPAQPQLVDRRPWSQVRVGATLAALVLLALSLAVAYSPLGG